jgi:hypothetical protein
MLPTCCCFRRSESSSSSGPRRRQPAPLRRSVSRSRSRGEDRSRRPVSHTRTVRRVASSRSRSRRRSLSVSSRSRSRTISPRYSFLTTDVPFQCFHNMAGIYVYIGPKFVPRPLPYANIFFSRSFLPFYCLPFCISFTVLALINLYIKSFLLYRLAFCHVSCSLLNIFAPK